MRVSPELSNATWRASSYSNSNGGECVEVAQDFPGAANWRKSSHSNIDGGNCLEIAAGLTGIVPVRDSKQVDGPVLVVPAGAWAAFVTEVKKSA